jgi:amino acid adenylation domain-containing protein
VTRAADERLRQRLADRVARARTPGAQAAARIPSRPDPDAPAPLTAAQARMWLAAELEPDSPAYNVQVALRLQGTLDMAALRAAVTGVVTRHRVLRSVVEVRDGTPVAVVRAPAAVPFDTAEVAEADLAAALLAEAERPFTLASDCPMRVTCYRLGNATGVTATHVLALTFHHIAVDAWALRLVVDELGQRYAGEATEPLPALQVADVAEWELATIDPARVEAAVQWWRQTLCEAPPLLPLATDRPRTATTGSGGAEVPAHLDAALTRQIRQAAAATGTTVFMVLLAAWQALLGRLCDVDDLVVGAVTAGRRHPDVEPVVGCFVDTVALRADLSGTPTGRDLLIRARAATLGAIAHVDAPLPAVLDAVRATRVPGAHPLFQVLLNVYDDPLVASAWPGIEVCAEQVPTRTAKFDLSLNVADPGPGHALHGWLVYRSELFRPDTVERLVGRFNTLLRGMLADLDRPIAEVPVDEEGAVATVHGPARGYPVDVPLHVLVERWVGDRPDAVAVVAPDGALTYAELERRANRLANRLLAAGIRADDPVAVWVGARTDLAVGLLGALKAGGAYLPVDPGHPAGRVRRMLDAAGCRYVVASPELTDRLGDARDLLVLDATDSTGDAGRPDSTVDSSALAYAIFTSGSTGTPKGVAVEHRSITHYLYGVLEKLGEAATGASSWALVSTPAADLGLTCVLGALVTGGTLHLVDRDCAVDPAALGAYLRAHSIDVLKCVPSQLRLLGTHGDLAGVLPRRLLIVAGEACPWSLVDQIRSVRPDLAIQSHYGPTETTVAVLACDVDEVPRERRHGTVPLGRPMADAICHVVGRDGRLVPLGTPGELYIGGPGVARGYLGRPDLTAERFVTYPGGGRFYRSGDRVVLEPDGTLRFLGRIDDQLKVRGYRVEPGEVAAACREVPGVADAIVLATGEEPHRQLAAWLVRAPGSTADLAAVRNALRERLPDYLVPSAIVMLDRFPLNPNGKVDRAALPAPEALPPAALRTPTEHAVAAAWAAQLGVTDVGADDDFFALGGDSFTAVRAVRAIDSRLRVIDLFTNRTVRELAAYLDGLAGDTGRLLHRLAGPPRGAAATLTAVCIPYGGGSAAAYQPLADALARRSGPSGPIDVYAVELPGHDPGRPDEAPLPIGELAERCAAEIAALPDLPVLVYGHCVGTAAAVALAARLEADGRTVVGVVLAASFPTARLPGRLATWWSRIMPTDRLLSNRAYKDFLTVIGGMESGSDLDADVMLRALRHDARQAEDWYSRALADPDRPQLRAPILSVIGERDRTTELYTERYHEWRVFGSTVELATIPRAGHYFLKHQSERLAEIVTDWLGRGAARQPAGPAPSVGGFRDFAIVAGGQFASMIGTQLSTFAMGVWVYQQTGRLFDFALLTMLALVPAILAAPIGGALVDRYDRRRVMLIADATAAAALGSLSLLLWLGWLELWQVLVAVTVGSVANAIQRPAYLAAVAQLVPKPYLPQANAVANSGTGVGILLGPVAGGLLVTLVGLHGVVALDMITSLIAVGTLLAVRFPNRLFRRRDETFGRALAGGWRFVIRRRPMLVMIAFFVPVNYLIAVVTVLVTPWVLSFGDAVTLGVVTAAGGVGAVAGTVAMVVWGGTRRLAVGMVGFTAGMGVGSIVAGLWPAPVAAAVGLFLYWAALTVLNAHWVSIIQIKVGQELQGRVLSVNQLLATTMMPVGFVTAPALADLVGGVATLLILSGAVLVAWSAAGLAYRPLRRMEDDLPDAVAGPEIAGDLDEVQRDADASFVRRS